MNYRFDIQEWLPRFPLNRDDRGLPRTWYEVSGITGPSHLCDVEQLRHELRDVIEWGSPVPMDVFVMGDGEPVNRHATKIAGLPFRPADMPWLRRRVHLHLNRRTWPTALA